MSLVFLNNVTEVTLVKSLNYPSMGMVAKENKHVISGLELSAPSPTPPPLGEERSWRLRSVTPGQ